MGAGTFTKKEMFRLHMREVEEDYTTLTRDCEYYESQYEELSEENDRLYQKTVALQSKIDRLNDVIHRQRKQLTEVQEAISKRNADNERLKQASKKLFGTVNHFCVRGYPCISCPLCREDAPCDLVRSYFTLKELRCDMKDWHFLENHIDIKTTMTYNEVV